MQNISKPSHDELQVRLDALLSVHEVSSPEWLKRMVDGFHAVLDKDPLSYRVFGPWWWLLKQIFIEQGQYVDFGTSVDAEWIEATDYDSADLNMLAIHMNYDQNHDLGLLYSSEHNIVTDDGEAVHYVLIDEDMEMLALDKASRR